MILHMNLQNQFMPQSLGLNHENLGQNQGETLTFSQIVLIPMLALVAGGEVCSVFPGRED